MNTVIKKKMSYKCVCNNGDVYLNAKSCTACQGLCTSQNDTLALCEDTSSTIFGVTTTAYIILITLSFVLFLVVLMYAILVIRKCNQRSDMSPWVPTIFILLILFLFLFWVPGLGLVMFVILLVILILANDQCLRKNPA